MNKVNVREAEEWSNLLDKLTDELREDSIAECPPLELGQSWTDPSGTVWTKVKIRYGAIGGRWCYTSSDLKDGMIVDNIFNGNSSFFAGMLRIPFDGVTKEALMINNYEK